MHEKDHHRPPHYFPLFPYLFLSHNNYQEFASWSSRQDRRDSGLLSHAIESVSVLIYAALYWESKRAELSEGRWENERRENHQIWVNGYTENYFSICISDLCIVLLLWPINIVINGGLASSPYRSRAVLYQQLLHEHGLLPARGQRYV